MPILQALKKGKEVVDLQVENALLKRALGYSYVETTKELTLEGELITKKTVTKEVAPDVTAQIFWLKNRSPEKWRQNPQAETAPEETGPTLAEVIQEAYKNRKKVQ